MGQLRSGPSAEGEGDDLALAAAGRFRDVRRLVEIDSTNSELLRLAAGGAPEGTVAVADHQSAGRGRLGRTWSAPVGSALLFSVLLRPALAPADLPLVTLAAAVAMRDAVAAAAGVEVHVKWPNDLRHGGRKLAGILSEAHSAHGSVEAVVVGVGLNLRDAALPPDVAARATSLERCGAPAGLRRRDVLRVFLDAYDSALGALESGRKDDVLGRYRAACETIGRRVRAQVAGGEVEGTAVGVDDDGSLVVQPDAGASRRVSFGEIEHLFDPPWGERAPPPRPPCPRPGTLTQWARGGRGPPDAAVRRPPRVERNSAHGIHPRSTGAARGGVLAAPSAAEGVPKRGPCLPLA